MNLEEAYTIYEKRYNLTKLAEESGIKNEDFEKMSAKEKFFVLSYRLKDSEHFHLASFFFSKLFEISQSMEALLNKIDCLIILGEFEEAYRFNCLGFELFLENFEVSPEKAERILSYQKAIILFSSEKFHEASDICENNIIKFEQKDSYPLLSAILIAKNDFSGARRIFTRYSYKFHSPYDFLAETSFLLLSINKIDHCVDFVVHICDLCNTTKAEIRSHLSTVYSSSKNKNTLKNFFEQELSAFKACEQNNP